MLIKNIVSNVNGGNSGEIEVEKGIGALILATTDQATIGDAVLRVWIDSPNGTEDIIDEVPVLDALLMGVFGDASLQSSGTRAIIGRIPLTKDGGAIQLLPQQKIKFLITGMDISSAKAVDLYGTEEPVYTLATQKYEKRNLTVDQSSVDVNVLGYDMLVLPNVTDITELQLKWSNGSETRHTLFELLVDGRSIDPIQHVKADGTVQQDFSKIFIPLSSPTNPLRVSSVNFRKASGTPIQISLRQE